MTMNASVTSEELTMTTALFAGVQVAALIVDACIGPI